MALTRGIQKAVERVVEELHKIAEKIDDKDDKEITEVATIAANNNAEIGKKLAEAMKLVGATNGVITDRGRQDGRHRSRRRAGHAVRSRLSVAALRHQSGRRDRRARKPLHPHLRREDQLRQEPDSAAGNDLQEERAAAHHRRGHRRRSPGDAGAEQAQGHPAGLRRQGAGLRRSPQGHARRHRHADRRQGDLQGSRHPAREHPAQAIWAGPRRSRSTPRTRPSPKAPATRRPSKAVSR